MTVVLARVDDRLIHGQVTVGWCQHLHPDHLVLADNAVAADPWQSRVYASSVPPRIRVSILSVAEAVNHLRTADPAQRVLVLTGNVPAMADLVSLGAPIDRVNLGGLHMGPGKREVFPFVYFDEVDLKSLLRLVNADVQLLAQQVPGGKEFRLEPATVRKLASSC